MVNIGKVKEVANNFARGLMLQMAPEIAGGLINELFHQWNMDVAKVAEDVRENNSFWFKMDAEQHEQLRALAEKLGDVDFLTADVVINGIKKDFPGVASLILNWPEAAEWLLLQIADVKARVRPRP